MRAPISILLIIAISFPYAASAEQSALEQLTLKEAYKLALVRSETIAISQEVINETRGRFLQAFNGVLPQVSFVDTEKYQDAKRDDTVNRRYTPQRAFSFSQPLFSGFKEFAAIAGSKAEKKQRQQELIRAKQLLFIDVSDAFYLYKSYSEDVMALEEVDKALTDRLAELKRREALGRSKQSEVASTESKFYQNQAEIESVKSQRDVTRELLEFLVGAPISSIKNADIVIDSLSPASAFLTKVDGRADVVAASEATKVAQKKVVIARAGFWPTVNVVGNSYVKRVGSASNVDWDVTLNVDVPLFNGTQTVGAVKEAKAIATEATLNYSKVKREALLDIQNTYTKLNADLRQRMAYEKAYQAALNNYQLQQQDYQKNLVNNLDVLTALEDLQITHRSLIDIDAQTQRAYWSLRIATGDLNDDAI